MELDLSIPGAKQERTKLKLMHELLNHPSIVPEQCYRMATSSFPLVSYVNHIIGLYLSKNYEVIPIFIGRAHRHIVDKPAQQNAVTNYRLVEIYLRQVAYVLQTYSAISEEVLHAYVPNDILTAGAQETDVLLKEFLQ
ncbi:hypothetical protein [Collimonas sp.]|uniref:hypothetical protein n=1 Tax=Collimonas sp. TaxID=1963772 RepID=UPI002B78458F|nr:hypothetical protein [Collimonas sp.]HWX02624.1 hypothetical protein [Collimonas sp.]